MAILGSYLVWKICFPIFLKRTCLERKAEDELCHRKDEKQVYCFNRTFLGVMRLANIFASMISDWSLSSKDNGKRQQRVTLVSRLQVLVAMQQSLGQFPLVQSWSTGVSGVRTSLVFEDFALLLVLSIYWTHPPPCSSAKQHFLLCS